MTKFEIKERLLNNDEWLERGIYAIWKYQTSSEKAVVDTHLNNGVGFSACDGSFLTSLGNWIDKRSNHGGNLKVFGHILSDKQRFVARKKMVKYAGQLERIASNNMYELQHLIPPVAPPQIIKNHIPEDLYWKQMAINEARAKGFDV
jgi:hypothetical protein